MSARARLRERRVAVALAGAVLLVLAGAVRVARSLEPTPVATIEVRPGRFLREVEARGSFKAVKATPILVPPQSGRPQKVAALARDGALLAQGDVVAEFDPYDAQREARDGEADLSAARAKVDKAGADGAKNERSIAIDQGLARDDLERARTFALTDETLYSKHQIIESRLSRELAATKLDVSGRRLEASRRLSAADRALGEIDAAKARLKLDRARQSLGALRVVAPHDGLLLLERNWRGELPFVGDTLWPGQKIAELPDLSQLEAKVFVLEADGAGLKPGLPARVAIEGRPGEELEATVARVEPLAKTTGWQSPVRYFEAALALSRTDPSFMKPGQRVRAILRLEQADGVLAVPRAAVFEREGRRVVYRRQAGGFVPVEVRIGRQSVSRVVIDQGVAPGDVIALRDPTARAGPREGGPPAAGGPPR